MKRFEQHCTSKAEHPSSQRGAVLLLVLWVATFFGIVLSSFAFSMRTELHAVRNFKERAEAYMLAKAGIAKAVVELVNAGRRQAVSTPIFRPYNSGDVPLGRGSYRVIVIDEESRISLNQAPAEVLRRLLRNTGVSDGRLLNTIVDSILDWRDQDDFHHVNGAEAEYYRSLSPSYYPRNGPFEVLEEILLVKGMSREILYGNFRDPDSRNFIRAQDPQDRVFRTGEYLGIHSFLTVHGSGQVNPNSASLDVLVAVGLPAEVAKAILHGRGDEQIRVRPPRASRGVKWTLSPRTYRIESIGQNNGSRVAYRIVASMLKEGGPGSPQFRVIAWKEGPG